MKSVVCASVLVGVLGTLMVNGGYVGSAVVAPGLGLPGPVYGAHYGYSAVPVVKSLSSVAVAHAPLATSYANTYKFSHPVVKPIVKHYAPYYNYYSPLYAYSQPHDYHYDYSPYSYSPYYLHK